MLKFTKRDIERLRQMVAWNEARKAEEAATQQPAKINKESK